VNWKGGPHIEQKKKKEKRKNGEGEGGQGPSSWVEFGKGKPEFELVRKGKKKKGREETKTVVAQSILAPWKRKKKGGEKRHLVGDETYLDVPWRRKGFLPSVEGKKQFSQPKTKHQ